MTAVYMGKWRAKEKGFMLEIQGIHDISDTSFLFYVSLLSRNALDLIWQA
jgi:hypothetical protein